MRSDRVKLERTYLLEFLLGGAGATAGRPHIWSPTGAPNVSGELYVPLRILNRGMEKEAQGDCIDGNCDPRLSTRKFEQRRSPSGFFAPETLGVALVGAHAEGKTVFLTRIAQSCSAASGAPKLERDLNLANLRSTGHRYYNIV